MRVATLSGVLMLSASAALAQAAPGGAPTPQTSGIPTVPQQSIAQPALPQSTQSVPQPLQSQQQQQQPPQPMMGLLGQQGSSGSPTPPPAQAGQAARGDQLLQNFRMQVQSELRAREAEAAQLQQEIQRLQMLDQRLQVDGPR